MPVKSANTSPVRSFQRGVLWFTALSQCGGGALGHGETKKKSNKLANLTSSVVIRSDLFRRTRSERASWLITRVEVGSPALSSPAADAPTASVPPSPDEQPPLPGINAPTESSGGAFAFGTASVRNSRGESQRHTTASRRTCS